MGRFVHADGKQKGDHLAHDLGDSRRHGQILIFDEVFRRPLILAKGDSSKGVILAKDSNPSG
jgi:hypothetical protein